MIYTIYTQVFVEIQMTKRLAMIYIIDIRNDLYHIYTGVRGNTSD